ncbi:uncharacterized protein LOC113381056 [Ctenocephalides felis]|uniref:uncharacterized protein LOC113381056 n=1 Tax=Ctenocephalides felis TaxID=7515 RepID=UPI000E6E2B88|nr:uncharacterized protein LOC113381056 [Ctenocephalides felis]
MTENLTSVIENNEKLLTEEQKLIYDRVMLTVAVEQGGFFFLDAPGGTFVISLILAKVRLQKIALAVASSGIAATLLEGGQTAHSTFKLSLDIHNKENATYLKGSDQIFGGAFLLLSADFRQTLPVIPRSTYADEINACLKQSFLWRSVEKLKLTINMRVRLEQGPSAQMFSEQLIDIGNGAKIQQLIPGDVMSFKSIDTVVDDNESVNYPTEFLNSIDVPEMPPH